MRWIALALIILWSANCANAQVADRVVVMKSERRLQLMNGDAVMKSYAIALGGSPVGHKQKEGDQRTPEGQYVLDWRNDASAFYRSIHVSYPNGVDKERARHAGDDPGGMIMIHGQRNYLGWLSFVKQLFDWTDGCMAVTNDEMDEIWALVGNGTPIEIRP